MKWIDLNTWKRKKHYDMFTAMSHPHFSVTSEVDITTFLAWCKEGKRPFYHTMIYAVTQAANRLPEFRQRIRENGVVEHAWVYPSFTFLKDGDLFDFTTVRETDDFQRFLQLAKEKADTAGPPDLSDEPGVDDLLFITCLPWIPFTHITHPIHNDSFPRLAWGKYVRRGDQITLPFNIQAHHGLVDGIHAAKLLHELQKVLDTPEALLESS